MWANTKPTLNPQPSNERMKIMANHGSATARSEAPHVTNSIIQSIRRRAQSIIDNRSIDGETRAIIRYGLETNDPLLSELVCRVDAGETIIDNLNVAHTSEKKIAVLADLICRAGDEPATKSAALFVLMAALENATHPKALANTAKHFAFTRCGDLNFCSVVDAQVAVFEGELLAGNTLLS